MKMINLLRISIYLALKIVFINSIKSGNETDSGFWGSFYEYQFPFKYKGEQYMFAGGSADQSWVTRRIDENAKLSKEDVNKGTFEYSYEKMFPIYGHDDNFFVFCIFDKHFWTIEEIYPLKNIAPQKQTDSGCFYIKPIIVSSYKENGRVYVVIVAKGGNQWYIREFLNHGKFGPETENGSWNKNCKLGLTYHSDRQYFHCVDQNNTYWLTMKLLSNGNMSEDKKESGNLGSFIYNYSPTSVMVQSKYYIVAEVRFGNGSGYIFYETLPGGIIKNSGLSIGYPTIKVIVFAFNIKEKCFLYRCSRTNNYYRIFNIIE